MAHAERQHRLIWQLVWNQFGLCVSTGPGTAKNEGKIKGPARAGPHNESARGVGPAQDYASRVLILGAMVRACRIFGVLFVNHWTMANASPRWSLHHGLA
jgi:hypothetical protein